jgi:hypothetical protein
MVVQVLQVISQAQLFTMVVVAQVVQNQVGLLTVSAHLVL